MKICLTLDYELFLGKSTGSVENCLVKPLECMLDRVAATGAKFTIFVDATYLCALKREMNEHDELRSDFERVTAHLRQLNETGHDIQLHIHPQWLYSHYERGVWQMDSKHYKLCDLSAQEADAAFAESKHLLDSVVGKSTTCFRAGGFSTQPTELLAMLFKNNHIMLDASVCPGISYDSPQQQYDYTNAPDCDYYHFERDICVPQDDGRFVEVPISMCDVSPFFHWRLAMNRLTKNKAHLTMGDGESVPAASASIVSRLFHYNRCMATIDGFKIKFLEKAYNEARKNNKTVMCVLGHPKLATPYSLKKLQRFCEMVIANNDEFATLSTLI